MTHEWHFLSTNAFLKRAEEKKVSRKNWYAPRKRKKVLKSFTKLSKSIKSWELFPKRNLLSVDPSNLHKSFPNPPKSPTKPNKRKNRITVPIQFKKHTKHWKFFSSSNRKKSDHQSTSEFGFHQSPATAFLFNSPYLPPDVARAWNTGDFRISRTPEATRGVGSYSSEVFSCSWCCHIVCFLLNFRMSSDHEC